MKYDVRISNLRTDGAIKAYASVNLNDEFAITGVKIMEGNKGTFISMPNYKTSKGEYKDICFPITKEARDGLENAVLSAYEHQLAVGGNITQNANENQSSNAAKQTGSSCHSLQEMSGM